MENYFVRKQIFFKLAPRLRMKKSSPKKRASEIELDVWKTHPSVLAYKDMKKALQYLPGKETCSQRSHGTFGFMVI